jgi:dephospho-CoA kinase
MLGQLGAEVIEADTIAHNQLAEPEVIKLLIERWGRGVVDEAGQVDRRAVAGLVFGEADQDQRKWLESVIHPRVRAEMNRRIDAASARGQQVFAIDVPLLLEVGWADRCQFNLYVDTPAAKRSEWGGARGWSADELARRQAAQAPLETKRAAATHVVDNSGDKLDLWAEVQRFWSQEVAPLLSAG